MAERVEIQVDVTVKCSACNEELSCAVSVDGWGDIDVSVDPCDCNKEEE